MLVLKIKEKNLEKYFFHSLENSGSVQVLYSIAKECYVTMLSLGLIAPQFNSGYIFFK